MRGMLTGVLTGMLIVVTAGCQSAASRRRAEEDRTINQALVSNYNDAAVENALVAQHTVYPYWFVRNSAEPNELGRYQLDVLTEHYLKYPGQLNIWAGEADEELYERRVAYVRTHLSEAGVNLDKMELDDSLPGGKGVPSTRAVKMNEDSTDNQSYERETDRSSVN